jgi:formylmethanofuran dehydrogenase subunit E
MNIGKYTYDEYIETVRSFHGSIAPGMIAGGIMVDIAQKNLPEGEFFDVICETAKCLPDAVQLLTPCTIGNGWLKIVNTSRYAMTFYNKYTGKGIRVYLDAEKLDDWPELRSWFLRQKPKHEQDLHLILEQFRGAGATIYGTQRVQVSPEFIQGTKKHHAIAICPSCHEAYSSDLGAVCPACQGKTPYKVEE